jgi:dipeptide/tripeptide permease
MATPTPSAPAIAPIPRENRWGVFNHPLGFWFFFWGEFAERCSYYGMRAILLLYMTERLGFTDGAASATMSLFIAACYFLPLVGGYVADNYFGKYRTIVAFSLPYILGHVVLGIENVMFLVIALALLAMGSGVIKPNISTLMGLTYDQKRPGQTKLRSDAFAMFYGAVNVGAALSAFAMPALRDEYGYRVAFLFPAALMVMAFAIFAAGKPFYAVETIQREPLSRAERRERLAVLARLLGLFLVVAFFWSIFDQSASTWTLFARDHLRLECFGYPLKPDQIQGLNPILIVLFLPPITWLWHVLPRLGVKLRPTDKMLIGFVLTGITMATMSAAGFLAGEEGRVSVAWEAFSYVLITVAEICISVVGLELSFAAAPPTMKSFVTACWLLTVFFGNMLNSQITPLYNKQVAGLNLTPGVYFGLFALASVPVTLAFLWVSRRWITSEETPSPPHPE